MLDVCPPVFATTEPCRGGRHGWDHETDGTACYHAEKETPYSLRTQIYLSVQSASLVLDGPNNTQVRRNSQRNSCAHPRYHSNRFADLKNYHQARSSISKHAVFDGISIYEEKVLSILLV